MLINTAGRLNDSPYTKEEIMPFLEIRKTSLNDAFGMCETLKKGFDLPRIEEAIMQLVHSNVLLNECVLLVDKRNGDVYGQLIFCEYPIDQGSPIMIQNKEVGEFLKGFKQVNGHSFILDERLRRIGL